MNQINLNPAPVVSMRIKNTEISWSSEADKNAQENKNKKLKKSLKKKRKND
ncbi:hypothetical protein [Flavobacterium piscisymbiosum]|uniref:Uncharacterized protein n=1 Tax=Flavobacterium piscisymbiosum TaxID=2893753 RepID=A0ABS8MKW5_9FLAO|nr:hypothetical protein [Flavobacterium sp. F-30]MCC9066117.1 hypothetical protein [Flavobacterium sp. F-30]